MIFLTMFSNRLSINTLVQETNILESFIFYIDNFIVIITLNTKSVFKLLCNHKFEFFCSIMVPPNYIL